MPKDHEENESKRLESERSIISPDDELGNRRLRAWQLQQKGLTYREIAKLLGVSASTVSKWIKLGREGGIEALRSSDYKQVLTVAQLMILAKDLDQGALAFGFPDDEWTAERFNWLVKHRFNIE